MNNNLKNPSSEFISGPGSHEYWIRQAIIEAERAYDLDEVPIGCVIVQNNRLIARGHNLTEQLKDATAHAEMMAITAASAALESRYLADVTLYATIEPCPMCAGAIVLAKIPRLVFGAYDPKAGACGTLYNITQDKRLNHRVEVLPGVLDGQCAALMQSYFQKQRTKAPFERSST